jgi:hypothetical protein
MIQLTAKATLGNYHSHGTSLSPGVPPLLVRLYKYVSVGSCCSLTPPITSKLDRNDVVLFVPPAVGYAERFTILKV